MSKFGSKETTIGIHTISDLHIDQYVLQRWQWKAWNFLLLSQTENPSQELNTQYYLLYKNAILSDQEAQVFALDLDHQFAFSESVAIFLKVIIGDLVSTQPLQSIDEVYTFAERLARRAFVFNLGRFPNTDEMFEIREVSFGEFDAKIEEEKKQKKFTEYTERVDPQIINLTVERKKRRS